MSSSGSTIARKEGPASRRRGAAGRESGFFARRFPTFHAWVGNLGWPILLKQLRTEFRKNRFFYSHFLCLAALGGTLLVIITTKASDLKVTPTQVGQSVFTWFLIIQFLVVLVIFPAFSATAFTEERGQLSLDLLLITTLRPEEIVWGKFLASTIYCFLYIMATVPLLAVSFLFGGVTVTEVLLAYGILVGTMLIVSMTSLCISSCFASNIRATLSVYVVVLLTLLYVHFGIYVPVSEAHDPNQTVLSTLEEVWGLGGETAWLQWMVLALDLGAVFWVLFLVAANRIRPAAEDHTSKLRVLLFIYLPLRAIGGFYEEFSEELIFGTALSDEAIAEGMAGTYGCIPLAALLLFIVTVTFSTEEANVSRKCRRLFAQYTGPRYLARLTAPGAFWGLVYSVLLGVIVCGCLYGLFAYHTSGQASPETILLVREALMMLPIYLAGFAALGFLLSVCGFTPLYSRLTVTFIFIITLLLPMIFRISDAPDRIYNLYYLSPLVLWESLAYLMEPPPTGEVRYRLWGIHIVDIAKVVFALVFVALFWAGAVLARRASLPLLRFAHPSRRAA